MRRLEERVEVEASPCAVWLVLRDYGGVARWAPGVATSRSVGEPTAGVGARRVLRHLWGFRLEEVVTAWTEGRGYSFDVRRAPLPLKNVREAWAVDAQPRGASVSTTVEYETRLGAIGRAIDRLFVSHLIRREMRLGLAGLSRVVDAMTSTSQAPSREPSASISSDAV